MKNPFKRLTDAEKQIQDLSIKLEQLYSLSLSIAVIMNINPKIIQEKMSQKEDLIKYLIRMSENVKNN